VKQNIRLDLFKHLIHHNYLDHHNLSTALIFENMGYMI